MALLLHVLARHIFRMSEANQKCYHLACGWYYALIQLF